MGEKDDNAIRHDPYDGIFYNIEDNEEKTNIQFVSVLLFRLLLNKMQSDFQLPTDVHVYRLNTRKQKIKCHIVLNAMKNSIEVSEAGHRAWKDEYLNKTIPSLLSQLVEKTNQGIDLCDNEDTIQDNKLDNENVSVIDLQESNEVSKTVTQSSSANKDILNQLTDLQEQIQQIREERHRSNHSYAAVASSAPKVVTAPTSSASSGKSQASLNQHKPGPHNQTHADSAKTHLA